VIGGRSPAGVPRDRALGLPFLALAFIAGRLARNVGSANAKAEPKPAA
jgi:hypothetical protein